MNDPAPKTFGCNCHDRHLRSHLPDRAEPGCEAAIVSGQRLRPAERLTAPQHIEGRPERKVLEQIQVHVAVAPGIHEDVLCILRPLLELVPAPAGIRGQGVKERSEQPKSLRCLACRQPHRQIKCSGSLPSGLELKELLCECRQAVQRKLKFDEIVCICTLHRPQQAATGS